MIICLGTTPTVQRSMTFASLKLDAVNRADSVHEYASGKSTNAARVLHALGRDVIATGFLGGDRGKFFRDDLDHVGIEHDFVEAEALTRLCTTVIDQSAGTATELIEESAPLLLADYDALLERLDELLDQANLLVLSGSLPPGAPDDFYARCAQVAGDRARIILDAVGEPLLRALPHRPLIIKPNQSEVARTLDIQIDTEDALRDAMQRLIKLGAKWVVVTRGVRPAILTDGNTFLQVPTPSVRVVSAIGSGDSFAAGLAAALDQDRDVLDSCILAAACGAANAATAYAGHVDPALVSQLAAQIRITT